MLISTLDDPVDTIVLTATQGNGFEIYAGRTNETLTVDNNQNEYDISTPLDSDNTLNELSEDASIGDVVGITAYAEDLDVADSVSYILSNDAGGLFAIDSQSGVVTLAGQLDYETQTSHMISVLASSTDGSESSSDFMIDVVDEIEKEFPTAHLSDGSSLVFFHAWSSISQLELPQW